MFNYINTPATTKHIEEVNIFTGMRTLKYVTLRQYINIWEHKNMKQ